MKRPRFYCPGEITVGKLVELPAAAAHHAKRVLRLEPGDEITLFNGTGGEYTAVIARLDKNVAAALVETHAVIERESPLCIVLAQAVSSSEKMDWIVQKAVELGVSRIQPITANRSVVRLAGERADKRVQHWQQVALSACEQCGRNRLPQVQPLMTLPDWLGGLNPRKDATTATAGELRLMLAPGATQGLRDFAKPAPAAAITLLVGPEGGFAPEEEAAALIAGFTPLRLGTRTLRTESAALAAVAAIQARWGDY